ncbi:MAG: tRNA (N(6)-L-threonylcarbamoyladenosine(37)-C(2))-methylthiotransferase MtaB, partial [Clostridia bacterium]|nr:tRNA (N(6)-L-threonylcarbamoyladenosine(37)-C(2))-methylthiotransferase MtaB [Clostridia bacterium]
MRVAFFTLGCKVNQYETQVMTERLSQAGFEIVSHNDNADIYIVNSCTVTATSDQKTRQCVRRFKKNHPQSVVVLTGCMPQAYPQNADILPEADIVLGNRNTDILISAIDEYFLSGKRIFNVKNIVDKEEFESMQISGFNERTRAFVKIEDGCNRFCSYCIIPTARGRVRSKPLDELRTELEALEKSGFLEIVLVGINLSAYGLGTDKNICDAVELACSFEGFKRVRLGSLEPDHITREVIERLSKCDKLCPQFHISLQSGCDETLKRMNRHYTTEEYRQLCRDLRANFENCAITTDVMVGFAGETEEEFNSSLEFVKEIAFSDAHVFAYSRRAGTRAADFPNQVLKSDKEKRSKLMIKATQESCAKYLASRVGKIADVLFEIIDKDGYCVGHTSDYVLVKVKAPEITCGSIYQVMITGAESTY